MASIMVENLSKRFGNFVAVDDVSFRAEEGELVALLGPSGSGKSTILRMIAGLEIPDRGKTYLYGKDVTHTVSRKRKVGFVFQHYALFKHMTVEKNIGFGLEIMKKKKDFIKDKVEKLINLVNLNGYESHFPAQLSGGQRQRVALARALAPEPKIMLLDEPFGSLDAKIRENLANWIRDLHQKINVTSVFVTHDQNEAIKIADKIVAINRGKVDQIGTAKEVYEHPETKFVASFIGNTNVIVGKLHDHKLYIENMAGEIPTKSLKAPKNGSMVLLVRPEDILISKKKTRECPIKGTIKDIYYRGSAYEINILTGDIIINVVEEKNRFQKKKIANNATVYLGFVKYNIFNAPEGRKIIEEKLSQLGYLE
ncbi:MAG: ABC transporter ATP-binding protein [Candidatus Aminicenantes bacterium]|nr:ABC transporter ATP-binding protein [Candidatus Aminicenantes bacterium]